MTETYTETETPKVDLESLSNICKGVRNEFIQSFIGLPIKVDESLEGSRYYIAVSRELLKEIEAEQVKQVIINDIQRNGAIRQAIER